MSLIEADLGVDIGQHIGVLSRAILDTGLAAGLLGLVPNCAVSVAGAELYCQGAMSAGALMASSFTGAGVGLIVLFRTNRDLCENLLILACVYVLGVAFGFLSGFLL